jgi:hypothetical protein
MNPNDVFTVFHRVRSPYSQLFKQQRPGDIYAIIKITLIKIPIIEGAYETF